MKRKGQHILQALLIGLFVASQAVFAGAAQLAPRVNRAMGEPSAPEECTTDYKTASRYFQNVLGEDAPLERIPPFTGVFTAGGIPFKTENAIVPSGDQVFLNVRLALMGTDVAVPVKVCKADGKLVATLIMTAAVIKGKKPGTDTPLIKSMPKVRNEIVIDISRDQKNRNVVFKSVTFPDEPAASVSVK